MTTGRTYLIVAVSGALSACGSFLATPTTWNVDTGAVECSNAGAVLATAGAVVIGALAAAEISSADHPPPATDNPFVVSPDVERGVGYALAGASAITGAIATIKWASNAKCHRVDTRLRALIAAPDCATTARLDTELASIDPIFRDHVLRSDIKILRCVAAEGGAEAKGRAQALLAQRRDACVEYRRIAMQELEKFDDDSDRERALARLPVCDAPAANSQPARAAEDARPTDGLPDALDRDMIASGVAGVKSRVTACGDTSTAKGKVKLRVQVGGDGRVASVAVESAPDEALGACVAAAIRTASFAKTRDGGAFSESFEL